MTRPKGKIIIAVLILPILFIALCDASNAAPSGSIGAPTGTVADNVLVLYGEEEVIVTFKNTAGADSSDVASTIQYITLAAANLNPTRTQIDPLTATWEIYSPTNTLRTSGTVTGSLDSNAIYSPYSTTQKVYIYTWEIGPPNATLNAYTDQIQFNDGLRVLRPGETIKLTVKMKCQGVVGDSMFWFFFKSTEAHYTPGNYPTDISVIPSGNRMNLYYSKLPGADPMKYWLPLHNSYDPYDEDIGTGHNFSQLSWTRGPTIHAFAKGNKMVHQKPLEDPPKEKYSFHICGIKFDDSNRNGIFDAEIEHGIGLISDNVWVEPGVKITLLGPDKITKAEDYYPGNFTYPTPEGNPLYSGENGLRGSYCFNLDEVDPKGGVDGEGTYVFYVKIEEPPGSYATTPTLIGPIILKADADGPYESLDNHFGNSPPPPPSRPSTPVGGAFKPAGKLMILAPYVALAGLLGIVLAIAKRRRRA
ncbi:hypothetical protein KEJ44_06655 [Candidatus Bathyarchaeota archaeon]|nr:hypothetical protein [Candidatus Bathyarchaeota archaeon]